MPHNMPHKCPEIIGNPPASKSLLSDRIPLKCRCWNERGTMASNTIRIEGVPFPGNEGMDEEAEKALIASASKRLNALKTRLKTAGDGPKAGDAQKAHLGSELVRLHALFEAAKKSISRNARRSPNTRRWRGDRRSIGRSMSRPACTSRKRIAGNTGISSISGASIEQPKPSWRT